MRYTKSDMPFGKLIQCSQQIKSVLLGMLFAFAFATLAVCGAVASPAPATSPSPSPTGAALQVTTSSLPAGTQGLSYSTMLAAAGGTPPYKWSTTSGTLPAGLQLSTAGMIAGAATAAGSYSVRAEVEGAKGTCAGGSLALTW